MNEDQYVDLLEGMESAQNALDLFAKYGSHDRHLLTAYQAVRRAVAACDGERLPPQLASLHNDVLRLMDGLVEKMLVQTKAVPSRSAEAAETRARVIHAMCSTYLNLHYLQERWESRMPGARRPPSSVASHVKQRVKEAYKLDDRTIARYWEEEPVGGFLKTEEGLVYQTLVGAVERAGKRIRAAAGTDGVDDVPRRVASPRAERKNSVLRFGRKSHEN